MHLCIKNFRGFRRIGPIKVAPLTVLVGENSAGKTSFLAAIRFLYDIMASPEVASFNKAPFLLGAYDQVAHLRGGRGGRAPSFSFEIEDNIPLPPDDPRGHGPSTPVRCNLEIEFTNQFSQPALHSIKFAAGTMSAKINRGGSGSIEIETSEFSFKVEESEEDLFPSGIESGRHLFFVFQELLYLVDSRSRGKQQDSPRRNFLRSIMRRFNYFRRHFRRSVYASAPVRSQPDRAYTPLDASPTPEGTHVPYFLAKLKRHSPKEWLRIKSLIEDFGAKSGMFKHVDVKNIGRSESDPFQIIIDFGGPQRNIIDVGYGVSQILPVIAEILSRREGTLFLFQQPEVHLHPQAQAALGSFFVQQVVDSRHQFVLETHSDFIIDRIRMGVRDKRLSPDDVNMLYFTRDRLEASVNQIAIDSIGNIKNAPAEYRQFFLEEEIRSIG